MGNLKLEKEKYITNRYELYHKYIYELLKMKWGTNATSFTALCSYNCRKDQQTWNPSMQCNNARAGQPTACSTQQATTSSWDGLGGVRRNVRSLNSFFIGQEFHMTKLRKFAISGKHATLLRNKDYMWICRYRKIKDKENIFYYHFLLEASK